VRAPASATLNRSAAAFAALSLCVATGCAAGGEDGRGPAPAPPSASSGASGSSPTQDPSPEEQAMSENETQADRDAIVANFHARQRAMVDGDTDELRRLSTPDSHAQHISGYNQPRDEWFDQIESGYFDYHTVDNNSIDLTMTGPDSATLVSRSTIDVTIGGSRNTWRLESTADYVNVDGRWLSGDGRSRML
jgi:hypothetical protein